MTSHSPDNIKMDLEQVPASEAAEAASEAAAAASASGASEAASEAAAAGASGAEQVAPVSLTLLCLSNVKNLVDVAISRGAYKPNEVSTVGKIYDEFVAGLKTVTDAVAPTAPATDSAPTV